jgi:hypothetical protein
MFQFDKVEKIKLLNGIADVDSLFFSSDGRFKMKIQREGRSEKTWRLLVERIARTRVMSALANRKMPEMVFRSWAKYRAVK